MLSALLVAAQGLRLEAFARSVSADAAWALTCTLAEVQPLKLGVDVQLRESRGRGLGVFAARDILPGEVLGRYEGRLMSETQYTAAVATGSTTGAYAFELGDSGWLVDGENSLQANWLRFVNHSVRKANCEAGACKVFGETFAIYLEATRPISAGRECFFNYGREYWDRELGSRNRLTWRRLKIDYI